MINFNTPLPHDKDAEESLLAACLIDKTSLVDSLDLLQPDDFYSARNQKLFQCMKECEPVIEPAVLLSKIQSAGLSATILADLQNVPMAVDVKAVAGIIKEKSGVRKAIEISLSGINKLMSSNGDAASVLDAYQQSVLGIDTGCGGHGEAMHIGSIINDNIDRYEHAATMKGVSGVTTGLGDLDFILGGLQPSDLIILAARPSMGKTALAMNIVERCGVPALVFSLEMSRGQLVDRHLSSRSKINLTRLTTGRLAGSDWDVLSAAADHGSRLPVYIDDSPSLHFSEIRRRSRLEYKKHGIRLIVIDYLQLIRGDSGAKGNREAEISSISRALKAIAKELSIPVVALSQLNRELEKRSVKRPELSDLRESGQIEQDADVVVFIYRDEVYNKNDPGNKGKAEIIVAKHRNGPTGHAMVQFVAETTTFRNLYREKR